MSSASACDPRSFVALDVGRTQRVAPAAREISVRVPDHVRTVQPLAAVAIRLKTLSQGVRSVQNAGGGRTHIFFGQADVAVARTYTTNEIELAPGRMSLRLYAVSGVDKKAANDSLRL